MKILNIKIILLLICLSCQRESRQTEYTKDYIKENGIITLKGHSPIWQQIKLDTLKLSKGKEVWKSVGTVRIIPANNATVSSPFAGRIIDSFVEIGQKVNKGTPLFSLHSAEFYTAQKDLMDSKTEFNQAIIQLDRQKDLNEKGVGTKKDLEEAKVLYSIASTAYENNKAYLRIFGVNPEQSVIGQALTIYSPITGEVLKNQISIGQYYQEEDEPLLHIAQLDKVWIEAQVKEKDFNILHQVDYATITTDAYPNLEVIGNIKHINEIVDEETRSIQILIEATNSNKQFKPGMFVNIHLQGFNHNQLCIPKTAIMQDVDSQFVFVQNEDKSFKKVSIKTKNSNNDLYNIVVDGLHEGVKYIKEGGIYLANLR